MEGEVHLDHVCLSGNNYPIFNQAAKCNLTAQKVFGATGVLQAQPAIHGGWECLVSSAFPILPVHLSFPSFPAQTHLFLMEKIPT